MSLDKIGQLAIDLHAATQARKTAKEDLRDKYVEFCHGVGMYESDCREVDYIREDHPEYAEMQAYAAAEVSAYRRAQLDEYNIKRKLDRAIRSHRASGGAA